MKTLKLIVLIAALPIAAIAESNVGGFVDVQYHLKRGGSDDGLWTAQQNTFEVADGALYFNSSAGNTKLMVDLAFGNEAAGAGGGFTFADAKSQAYVNTTYDNGWSWSLGQFDKLYGFESNDSKDIMFSESGLVADLMPVTHTGIAVGYDMGDVDFHLLYGNSDQRDDQNTTTAANKEEMGVKIAWANDQYRFSAAMLNNENSSTETEALMDVMLGANFGAITLDFEYATIGNLGNAQLDDDVTAMGLFVNYAMDDCGLHFRYETTSHYDHEASAYAVDDANTRIALGFTHKMNDNTKVRADLFQSTIDDDSASADDTYMEGAISVVHMF